MRHDQNDNATKKAEHARKKQRREVDELLVMEDMSDE